MLKLAGELGTAAPRRAALGHRRLACGRSAAPRPTRCICRQNRLYEMKFLRALLRRFRRKAALFPRAYDPNRADGIRSLRDFDDRITAFYSGFSGADDYYYRAAAARVLDRIAVPTLILHALDDPFVRITAESRAQIEANPNITLIESSARRPLRLSRPARRANWLRRLLGRTHAAALCSANA